MKTRQFLTQLDRDQIVAAIREAERKTSGEIRVFVSRRHIADAVAEAQRHFIELGMTKTRHRNSVLLFVAPRARRFAVIGDTGVHERCGDAFWTSLAEEMSGHFRRGQFTPGILHAIRRAGALLAEHFPPQPGDTNELPDKVDED
jgi:uncharacterized membrane protein